MSNKYVIYSDNIVEAEWFKSLHSDFSSSECKVILGRGENANEIDELISYDRPDIILTEKGKPILVLEKTREVPTGHNVGQRMARLVKACESSVPFMFFFPFSARKHGAYTGICQLNIRILLAFKKMQEIHDSHALALNWVSNERGELVGNGNENTEIKSVLRSFLLEGKKCKQFETIKINMDAEYNKRLKKRKAYNSPPPSVVFVNTDRYLKSLNFRIEESDKISLLKKPESLVYNIGMEEKSCKRQDPYTGMQFLYDYAYCRTGTMPHEKEKNLILFFPKCRKSIWIDKNKNDIDSKSCNWYLTANAFVFKDGVSFLR
jgi:hypothetical protein